jgi:hypothetical protein
MEYEKTYTAVVSPMDIAKVQSSFFSSVVSTFSAEAFHVLRCYLAVVSNAKTLTNLLLRAQKFLEAGELSAKKGCSELDPQEMQGMLGVSEILNSVLLFVLKFIPCYFILVGL